MIEKFDTKCNCGESEKEGYNENWSHLPNCGAKDKLLKEKINEIIDKVNDQRNPNR